MTLALELCTKCGIETETVWGAWGIALLKLGKYQDARDKFKYCFGEGTTDKRKGRTQQMKDPAKILTEIITTLETTCVFDIERISKLFSALSHTATHSNPSAASAAFLSVFGQTQNPVSWKPFISQTQFEECMFYLKKYGNASSIVMFLLKHNCLEEAVAFIFDTKPKDSPQLFVEAIIQHCLAHDQLTELIEILKKLDNPPVFEKSIGCVNESCRYFTMRKSFDCLYMFQVLIGDHVRAGLTAVKLFMNTASFSEKQRYLNDAKQHMTQGLEQLRAEKRDKHLTQLQAQMQRESVGQKDTLQPRDAQTQQQLSETEVSKWIQSINLQCDVTEFLHTTPDKERGREEEIEGMHIFGNLKTKCETAEELVNNFGYDIAFRVITEYRLPIARIYESAAIKLAKKKNQAKLTELLKNIKGTVDDDDFDTVVMAAIKIFVKDHNDDQSAESLIQRLLDDHQRVMASVMCGKLKQAYLIAVKTSNVSDVEFIKGEAERTGNTAVADLCAAYLSAPR
eukprot:TRINITY_DN8335_c0_g1_i1.p1 TRINITY_DN8335_c0_g1~~TRINITY_DN8335_c0_g1_i1.p1  ORF type:complete len:565 (-),score=171.69 TRINITY_DN8335_c0_g1_i1:49-1581(-)